MARTKLKEEVLHYIGLPYFINKGKFKNHGDNVFVGKGTAKEIALKTIEFANTQDVKLLELTPEQIYNFQKKNHLGIDCSGLTTHLLNYYFDLNINPRITSANMLTSAPLSTKIKESEVDTGDLVRQDDGHHILFVLEKVDNVIYYVDSSAKGRGVRFGEFKLTDKNFHHDGFFRLNSLSV